MSERAEGYVSDYVRVHEGVYRVGESRVSLASIVINWRQHGLTPEQIHESFPTLSLAAIYGAIAYYLDHQEAVDAYLREEEELAQRLQAENEAAHPEFFARMRARLAEARAARAASEPPLASDASPATHETPAP